jgi:cation/acetate symporter
MMASRELAAMPRDAARRASAGRGAGGEPERAKPLGGLPRHSQPFAGDPDGTPAQQAAYQDARATFWR